MTPVVSIIMGSTSDLPVMEKAAKFLDEMEIPFEMHALSAHRTPAEVETFAKGAKGRGIKVIIAAAGMAAHLCGVIASMTTVPVIGVPINSTLDGMDALLAIVQMPPGIPVATGGISRSRIKMDISDQRSRIPLLIQLFTNLAQVSGFPFPLCRKTHILSSRLDHTDRLSYRQIGRASCRERV